MHGAQQMSMFRGYYNLCMYHPLVVFDGEGWPVAMVLRPGRASASEGVASVLLRIFEKIVDRLPRRTRVTFRADCRVCHSAVRRHEAPISPLRDRTAGIPWSVPRGWSMIDPSPPEMATEDYAPSRVLGPPRNLIGLSRVFITAYTGSMGTELTDDFIESVRDLSEGDRWLKTLRKLVRGNASATEALSQSLRFFEIFELLTSAGTEDPVH